MCPTYMVRTHKLHARDGDSQVVMYALAPYCQSFLKLRNSSRSGLRGIREPQEVSCSNNCYGGRMWHEYRPNTHQQSMSDRAGYICLAMTVWVGRVKTDWWPRRKKNITNLMVLSLFARGTPRFT